jgi:hypothetical protein
MSKLLTTLAAENTAIDTSKIKNQGAGLEGNEGLTDNITGIVNAIIGVLGIVAVVVIILGGISYMTSNGDASKVKKAKDTILYGVIGLVIVILSAAIVNFVIFKVAGPSE